MKPLDLPLLADENIDPEVIQALKERGKDIRSVHAEGLSGRDDVDILRYAHPRAWVVVTHDRDFGAWRSAEASPTQGSSI